MDTNGFLKRDKSRAFGRPCTRTRGLRIWRRIASAVLCAALLGTSIGGTLTAAVATDDLPVTVENKGETNGSVRTDADTQTECSTPSGADTEEDSTTSADSEAEGNPATSADSDTSEEAVYTLHLTHYFRFTVNGQSRHVSAEQKIELTEKDFKDGVCDLNHFAYSAQQLTVTEAKSLSLDTFDKNHEGGARIVYAVSSGWKLVPVSEAGNEGTVLRDVFQGELLNYEFVPANIIRMKVEYKYSSTGGLAGIDAAAPKIVEALPEEKPDGTYEIECELPTVTGFRIVLNPDPLNEYLVQKPTGKETPEELQEMLESGAFSVDVENQTVYYYQQTGKQTNLTYGNAYSDYYNQAWNKARTLEAKGYTATAICGNEHPDENHGANPLENPKLKVTLTEAQLQDALKNGLDITVSYRRNATWYTVNHWVPQDLSGLTADEISESGKETRTGENGVEYVLLDTEHLQGRVGSTTRATAKTDSGYALLTPLGFSQKLIENAGTDSATGTSVDIYYKELESYRVIFDTDYTYIPRLQIALDSSVDLTGMEPKRKGYTFGGWQYLRKDAKPDENGEYAADAYEKVGTDGSGNSTLKIDSELISQKAKLQETSGVLALHLYPIWKPAKTQVTVVLWTEDLDGLTDVYAKAEGERGDYYEKKYKDYGDELKSNEPSLKEANSNYSNAGSFTINNVETDSSLVQEGDSKALLGSIQTEVTREFAGSAKDTASIDASKFYTQHSFAILHETDGQVDYSTTTANADGKTMIYVYFTRNIYTLKFHYYGKANYYGSSSSDHCVAINTNGYSYAGAGEIINDDDELNFGYNKGHTIVDSEGHTKTESNKWVAAKEEPSVPQIITIQAKYGADLREVWPVALPEESVTSTEDKPITMCSWATTDGKYREEAITAGSSHFDEPTIMGLYTTMDSYIIADPGEPAKTHHLVAYWSQYTVSVYRYNHCYELPDLKIDDSTDVKTVSLYSDSTDLKNTLYLVPTDNEAITKFDFTDLLKVSYDEASETITYDDIRGNYYAVRGYTSDGKTKYYAVSRQVETVSTNSIEKQNPSARPHMTRANNNADHTTEHQDSDGMSWQGNVCGTKENPYDLYFYYDRESYTIRYVVPNTNENDPQTEDELGRIELPYGAHVTSEEYAFQLDYRDNNQNAEYGWTYLEGSEAVPVCPDRNPDGKTPWKFKGWGLGPAGANMLWEMPDDSHPEETQAQISDDFYIGSDLLLYAIWETPMLQVTFHLNGGQVSSKESIEVSIPSNTVYTAGGAIPRPVRNGYTLVGWYQSDEEGNPIGIKEEDLFNFDSVIIENQHVAAVWKEVETAKYNYNVYYVTQTLRDVDQERNLPTIQVDDRTGEIVKSGGTTYYVLDKDEKKDQMYVSGTALNLRATPQSGYTPRETTKLLELTDSNQSYNVIFFYDPWTTTGSYTVRFVEAGTEKKSDPTVVKTVQAEADQTVVTPGAAAVKEMTEKGYELVSRGADGKYTAVKEYQDLTWIDKDGRIQAMSTLAGTNIPDTVTYLVQPIAYTVTYQNAGGSPEAAGNALSALTAAENTPVNRAKDKNPTQYTTKDTFTLKNPTRVYDSGKWYQFSHWSLGDGTTVNPQQGAGETYTKLQVDPGTIGNLTFMANWEEVTDVGSLMVSKTVSGNQGDTSQKFTFTVTLGDTSIEGKYDEMTFHAGVATFTLKHGESVTAQNLPAGITYTVKETGNAGYTVTSSGEAGTIETGEKAIASFHNHKSGEDGSGEDKPTKPMKPTNLAETITPIEQSKLSSTTAVSPKTGDETNLTLWLAVLDLSGIGIIVILVAFRRHYKGK